MTVLDKFLSGNIRALSKIITYVENRRTGYRDLLGKIYPKIGNALRVGVTGPPGAGKSTIVNTLIARFIEDGKKVGVVAVDPTSPFSGGALLGDRVRLLEYADSQQVFFRSMASRGATGGLAGATDNVSVVLDAFGFDIVIIETVGVGQVELDVIDTCDTVVVALVPESGDAVQAMKAGLMEIADIMVVNKADRPGAENLIETLQYAFHLRTRDPNADEIRILMTQAANNIGIDELCAEILNFSDRIKSSGRFEKHRREQIKKKLMRILLDRFQREFISGLSSKVSLDELVEDIFNGKDNPYNAGDDLYRRFSPTKG